MVVDGFLLSLFFFLQRKFYGPEQRWMLISGKKTILFRQNNFCSHKTKYKMCSVTSLRVVSHVIAQLYMAVRKGFKVHLIAMQRVFIFLKSEDVTTLR